MVWTVNDAYERMPGEIMAVQAHPQTLNPRIAIALDDGRTIIVTLEHELFHPNCGEFHRADHFHAGDNLLEFDADTGLPSEVAVLLAQPFAGGPLDMYDITVAPHHVYLVAGVMAHNKAIDPRKLL